MSVVTYFLWLVCLLLVVAVMLLLFKPVRAPGKPPSARREAQGTGGLATGRITGRTTGPVTGRITGRDLRPRKPLSSRERVMYFRLVEAVAPYECVVLSQVSFSALIDTDDPGTRNVFCRKYTDFVVCNTEFDVLVVVELDDASHWGREEQDAAREALLTDAGHRVMRFDDVPSVQALRAQLLSGQVGSANDR